MAAKKKNNSTHDNFDFNTDFDYDINDEVKEKKRKTSDSGRADRGNNSRTNERTERAEKTEKTQRTEKTAKAEKRGSDPSSVGNQVIIALIFAFSLFVMICLIVGTNAEAVGTFGGVISNVLLGLFGIIAWLIPIVLAAYAVKWKKFIAEQNAGIKALYALFALTFAAVIVHAMFCIFGDKAVDGNLLFGGKFFANVGRLFSDGKKYVGGGVIGGFISCAMMKIVGKAGTLIFGILFFAMFTLFLIGSTPAQIWERVKFYILRASEQRVENKKRRALERDEKKREKRERKQVQTEFAVNRNVADYRPRPTSVTTIKGVKRGPGESSEFDTVQDMKPVRTRTEKRMADIGDSFAFGETEEVPAYRPQQTHTRHEILTPVSTQITRDPDNIRLDEIFDKPSDENVSRAFDMQKTDENMPAVTEATMDVALKGGCADDFAIAPVRAEYQPSEVAALPVSHKTETRKKAESEPCAGTDDDPAPWEEAPEPVKKPYVFPPVDFLPYKKSEVSDDSENEIRSNANKLVSTLSSFNIHTRVVSVSRGPTVTRYEIAPEAGTKVSAIVNRTDDISLNLASKVRVSGVIPGMSAVGVEVANKCVSTVYLRELIDNDKFREAKSAVTACLGIDLTGAKVYFDIAKMPHLLIAGTTGSGKSVCMNSIIVSLLYKSTPDEVKFIFIDPKKVELGIYNGLPHLLVPVVSDPKKAAGALHWCVNEMERRYEIMESMNKRNIQQYRDAIANDPTKEKLPIIVIVIDELADLMATSKDDVETSISRIAAKARAAGMHLIIGTQRPTVDVVTGTLKSNIPSRIAFTVSSQIDSRTILDNTGAEKLVGRGDMLYSPVGSMSPLRVQGSFVDDPEIEKIVNFIKDENGNGTYDRDVADSIEKEAEMCGKKGKSTVIDEGGDEDIASDEDPMYDAAVKLAIEAKKISTSLIQRRLALGYGRAAKLIDMMEERGIISGPNGQKPRDVLITYDDYLEKMQHGD